VECKAQQCLLKPDVTDETHNTLNNLIPSQNTMKILSTLKMKVLCWKKSLLEYQKVVVTY